MRYTKKSEKFINAYEWNRELPTKTFVQLGMNKLGQLEDIEEELGIDLVTLINALKNGIYGKIGNKIEHILAPHLSWYCQEIYIFKIKDYGKTWALTKEELE